MPLPVEESRPEALWNVLLSRFFWLLPCGGFYLAFSFIPWPSCKLDIMSKGSVYSITHWNKIQHKRCYVFDVAPLSFHIVDLLNHLLFFPKDYSQDQNTRGLHESQGHQESRWFTLILWDLIVNKEYHFQGNLFASLMEQTPNSTPREGPPQEMQACRPHSNS